jgi:starch-binding outer membrane protein, SusD/RagB family
MKNKIINLFIVAALILSSTACDDFLTREPISSITDDMLGIDPDASTDSVKYNSADLIEGLLTTAYRSYQTEYYQLDRYIIGDGQSDNAYSGEPKAQTTQIDQFSIDATNGNVSRDWRYMFQQVATANSLIQWVPLNTDPALTATRKKEIEGEARFIRATAYFNLVRIFGDVPLITREVPAISNKNLEEVYPLLYPERKPVDSIYNQIIADLNFATENCVDYSDFKFKISKPLAHAVLAEVYAAKGAPANVDWAKVKFHSNLVNTNTKYDLMTNFDDLWAAAADESGNKFEHSKESLFEVDCNSWSTIGNWAFQMFYGTDWKKFNTPSKDLVAAFTAAGDTKRQNASIKYENVTGKWSDQFWAASAYPFCYKLRVNEKGNIILWRLASNILLQAEAENELNNPDAAKVLLNKVRTRAGLANTTASTKEEIRIAIERERRLELAFEGYRWFDLVRTGRAIEVMKSCSDHQSTYAARLTPQRLFWPVPQTELDQNDLLTQNEGY